jgi:hypothetical protein
MQQLLNPTLPTLKSLLSTEMTLSSTKPCSYQWVKSLFSKLPRTTIAITNFLTPKTLLKMKTTLILITKISPKVEEDIKERKMSLNKNRRRSGKSIERRYRL